MGTFRIVKHEWGHRWIIQKRIFFVWVEWEPSARYIFRERENAEHFLEHNRPSYY